MGLIMTLQGLHPAVMHGTDSPDELLSPYTRTARAAAAAAVLRDTCGATRRVGV